MAPVGACLRRAGAQRVKGTCGPGIRRALGAAHSIPAVPLPLTPFLLPLPLAPLTYLPTPAPTCPASSFALLCSPSRPRVASARSNSPSSSGPVSSNSLSSLEPRLLFREFRRVRRATTYTSSRARLRAEFSQGKTFRDFLSEISFNLDLKRPLFNYTFSWISRIDIHLCKKYSFLSFLSYFLLFFLYLDAIPAIDSNAIKIKLRELLLH